MVHYQSASPLPPLKGIIHTAGVLEDASLSKQTWEKFERVFSPKILGAWNLHLLSQEVDLDWFITHIPHPQLSHKLSPSRDLSKNT